MFPRNISTSLITAGLAALLSLSSPSVGQGQTLVAQKTRILTIEEVIQMSLTNNLDILISKLTPVIDQFTINGLYGAYEPSLNFNAVHSYDSFPGGVFTEAGLRYPPTVENIDTYTPSFTGVLPTGLNYTITGPLSRQSVSGTPLEYTSNPGITVDQPLLKNFWIDQTRYQISLNKKNLRIDQLAFRLQVMTVINNIKAAYYNLIFDRQNVEVERAAVQLAQETAKEDEERVKVGALAPLDAKQAEAQEASAESDLLTADNTLLVQENVIKGLLALHLDQWTGVTPVPSEQLIAVPENPNVQECWRLGLEKRPDMVEAKLNVEKQHVTIKYDYNQLFPEIDLTGSYGGNATELSFNNNLNTIGHGSFPFYSYGVVLTIPLGNSGNRNNYKIAKAGLQQLLLQLKKVESTIVVAIDDDVKNVWADYLKVGYTRQARIYAEEALQAEQEKLQHGKSTSFVVLQLQNNLTTARSAEIRSLADYNIAVEQLAFDDGTTLERNHIEVNFH